MLRRRRTDSGGDGQNGNNSTKPGNAASTTRHGSFKFNRSKSNHKNNSSNSSAHSDPDPMFRALFCNFEEVESVLMSLTASARGYAQCVNTMAQGSLDLSNSLQEFCTDDAALKLDTSTYGAAIESVFGSGLLESKTEENINTSIEPSDDQKVANKPDMLRSVVVEEEEFLNDDEDEDEYDTATQSEGGDLEYDSESSSHVHTYAEEHDEPPTPAQSEENSEEKRGKFPKITIIEVEPSSSYTSQTTTCVQEFQSALDLKVLSPLQANLDVLADIRRQISERETVRKALGNQGSQLRLRRKDSEHHMEKVLEFERLTKSLFEQLTALYQHRFDFVRGSYQALKRLQYQFMCDGARMLEPIQGVAPRPTSSVEFPEDPTPLKLAEIGVESASNAAADAASQAHKAEAEASHTLQEGIFGALRKQNKNNKNDGNKHRRTRSSDKTGEAPPEIIIAKPESGAFNPDDDLPSAGSAFMRLGRARGADAVATRLKKKDGDEKNKRVFSSVVRSMKTSGNESEGEQPAMMKLNIKLPPRRKASGGRSLYQRDDSSSGEVPTKIAPMASDSVGEVPMKGYNGDEVPMKIAAVTNGSSGEIPMKMQSYSSGEVRMKIAPMGDDSCGEVPMKIAPMPSDSSGEIPMKIAPMASDSSGEVPMKGYMSGEVPIKIAPIVGGSSGEIPMKGYSNSGVVPMKIAPMLSDNGDSDDNSS